MKAKERQVEKPDDAAGPDIGPFEAEMNRGFLQVLVLALLEKPMYGYSMVKHMEEQGYALEENSLYPLLRRLEKNGWVRSRWEVEGERPKKYYTVTEEGRALRRELLRLHRRQNEILERLMEENVDA